MISKKYIAVIYDAATQKNLLNWSLDQGFDMTLNYEGVKTETPFEFHTTIMYSKNRIYLEDGIYDIGPHSAEIVRYSILFPGIKTFIVKSKFIDDLHIVYDSVGLQHTYSEFVPHVSLTYDRCTMFAEDVIIPSFPLIFDRLIIEDLQ